MYPETTAHDVCWEHQKEIRADPRVTGCSVPVDCVLAKGLHWSKDGGVCSTGRSTNGPPAPPRRAREGGNSSKGASYRSTGLRSSPAVDAGNVLKIMAVRLEIALK